MRHHRTVKLARGYRSRRTIRIGRLMLVLLLCLGGCGQRFVTTPLIQPHHAQLIDFEAQTVQFTGRAYVAPDDQQASAPTSAFTSVPIAP
jgi:hypothetical protein